MPPVARDVPSLRVGTLTIGSAAPRRDVQATLSEGADGGRQHRIDHLRLACERVQAECRLVAQTDAPLALDVALSAHDPPEDALPRRTGPCAGPLVCGLDGAPVSLLRAAAPPGRQRHAARPAGRLRCRGRPAGRAARRAAPQASASAHVTLFAGIPVSAVLASTV